MTRTSKHRGAKKLWDYELPGGGSEVSDGFRKLVIELRQQERIVVLKGAGVSVAAGSESKCVPGLNCLISHYDIRMLTGLLIVPPFRSEEGIFAQYELGEKLFHVDMFKNADDRTTYLQACDELYEKSKVAHPTKFDQSIATWENVGRIFTTNIDGIGTKDDTYPALNTTLPPTEPWPKTIALHGLLTYVFCDKCRKDFEYDVDKHGRFVDETACLDCGEGVLRPRVALYGDTDKKFTFDIQEHQRVIESDLLQGATGLVVAGTTLKVTDTQNIAKLFRNKIKEVHRDVRRYSIWINPTDLPPEGMRSLFTTVRGTADDFARVCESCFSDYTVRLLLRYSIQAITNSLIETSCYTFRCQG
jgi:NAD-dependent SIR2 family protein deacetylase